MNVDFSYSPWCHDKFCSQEINPEWWRTRIFERRGLSRKLTLAEKRNSRFQIMKLIRLIALFLSITGCLALPPTQSSSRGPVRPKQTTPISTNAATSTTTAIMTNVSTEARVKTSASTSATTATKKPISVKEATVTPPTSAKETRESPGKIRPQIKLTTNYTSASEVSTSKKVTTYAVFFSLLFLPSLQLFPLK